MEGEKNSAIRGKVKIVNMKSLIDLVTESIAIAGLEKEPKSTYAKIGIMQQGKAGRRANVFDTKGTSYKYHLSLSGNTLNAEK